MDTQPVEDQPYTLIPVRYRDASNYKEHHIYRAVGIITPAQRTALAAALFDDDLFIPTQIGLPHLGAAMTQFPDEDDHPFHELDLDDIETGIGDPKTSTIAVGPIDDFVNRMSAIGPDGWDASQPLD